ncbi:unnamed protein product [Cyclocybe aegerita]|uniref:Uncharacterized protein n=1 Tax=Cyclocybe aegerita TaxID=1973307 RepID=A0A8S0VWL8_CYCAE|nr:unnamed protein product [Cyclocybe aegerita]
MAGIQLSFSLLILPYYQLLDAAGPIDYLDLHTQKMLGPSSPDCSLLDYLLIPGPDPVAPLPDGCPKFLETRFDSLKGLLLIFTEGMAIAHTGLLDGYEVCTNKVAIKTVHEKGLIYKKAQWVGDRRWIRDGKI